ncbi:MAG TPA: N-acetylmuramoyl-L-alanine amidase [Lentisphaeria bacterium]|nr:MAG: hypothetical protein A2X48_10970 [Lentisphaerae bacterium GWF2_49_21]HBC87835.1 N-acetylmuramoyl-L-alanine amidase [Lentisphaeria bacterium]
MRKILTLGVFLFSAFISVFTFSAEAEAGQYIRYSSYQGMRYVYLRDVGAYYGMKLQLAAKTCDIRSQYSNATFTYNRREGRINGIKVNFMFPSVVSGNEPMISEYDFLLLLDPILRNSVVKHKVGVIVIDPGHGGKDNGAQGRFYKEKDLNLMMAKRLKEILSAKGYMALLTRDRDMFLDLDTRPAKASAYKADLFISIHCNSAGNGASPINGVETFCLTPEGAPSTADAKAKTARKERGNAFNKNNILLGYCVQRGVLRNTGANDRGVKEARFSILKDAPCPAILVETGFLSNLTEERNLATRAYQDKIAQGIAEGVIAYHRSMSRK